jgi:hypothetical protein
MQMHVSESWNEKSTGTVDDLCASRGVKRRGWADGRDARISDNDSGIGLWRRTGDCDYRNMSDGKAGRLRRGAGNQRNNRDKSEQETRQRSETWKIHMLIIACRKNGLEKESAVSWEQDRVIVTK